MTYDAILIGSGHNALAAAVVLARAGWKVVVFEQAREVGGGVRTAEWTLPGFHHDSFANRHLLIFLTSFYRQFAPQLRRHGLRYLRFDLPAATLFPDGDLVALHRDLSHTLASLTRQSAADADGWRRLYRLYSNLRAGISALLNSPVPAAGSLQALANARLRLGSRGNVDFAHLMTMSVRDMADRFFTQEKAKAWFAPWAFHADHTPETAGGAVLAWIALAAAQDPRAGLAIPEGGSGRLTQALAALLQSLGGEVRTGTRVTRILLRGTTACGVELSGGARVVARRAVVAGVPPTHLFLDLIGEDLLPPGFGRLVRAYRYGPSVVKLDFALSCRPAWIAAEAGEAGNLHLTRSVDDISLACNQALRGYLPEEPLLLVSQPTVVDPGRAPPGRHVLWVEARSVPFAVAGDAAGVIPPGPWERIKEPFADRVALLETYAPGFRQCILARNVLSPADLERLNPNFVRGDAGAGSHLLDQFYLFRPLPGWSRFRTPFRRLYMTGASTHPGIGVSCASGHAVARMLLG
ncbi:MAG: NAD(P)/FAD-dependent oxidoreductase [bacterium]|nr:NAD(P)/FAD-dependent oxidoreductase [bacterium]